MSVIFRIFLTLNSLSLTIGVFLVNNRIALINKLNTFNNMAVIWSYTLYIVCAISIAKISIWLGKYLANDEISEGSIIAVEPANDAYLPSYLGYFFVALSVQDFGVFIFVFGIISILTFTSRAGYFNPLYFLFGFRFYYAETSENVKIMIISRKNLKKPNLISFEKIKRINNYTFIDL